MSKEMSKEYVVLQSIVGSKSVSFHPDFARALGSVPAGLFLSQGFFWQFNAQHIERITIEGKQYFSRTISEWETETALSEEQQKSARAILIKAGILTEKKAGLPARLYYSFDFDSLVAVIYGYKETGNQVTVDNRSKKRYLPRTSSGKIRRQEAVKYGDNYKERDFNETLESLEREAQAPNSHSQQVDNFEQFEEEKKEPIPFPVPPSQIPLDARAMAKTPGELVAAMRKFYTDYPIEWSDGVLQLAKGSQYSEQKRQDIVTAWAAHQITQNQGGNTFAQLNASLQKWFRNQKDFDRQYGKPAEAAAPTRSDNSKPLPAYVE